MVILDVLQRFKTPTKKGGSNYDTKCIDSEAVVLEIWTV